MTHAHGNNKGESMDSILDSVKQMLGIEPDDESFDPELIMHINSTFMTLNTLGVGPDSAYSITGADNAWNEFFESKKDIEAVKSDIYLRVKLLFDSASMSAGLISAYQKQIDELEFRLMVQSETRK